MRPILYGKARAIPFPINLIVAVDALAFLKAYINGAFFNGIWGAVFSGMVLQRMHVFPEQFHGIVVSEYARRRRI
jgi:hypothetical protein